MPTEKELAPDEAIHRFHTRVSNLLKDILATTDWTDERLIRIAREADWAHTSMALAALAHTSKQSTLSLSPRLPNDGGGGPTAANKFSDEYDQCMKASSCTYSLLCLCCVPCSLQYVGCMGKVLAAAPGPPITTVIALDGTWASGGVPGPVISVNGNDISVDMSAYKRPTAMGYIVDSSDITVNFPDAGSYTAKLQPPKTISWSNNSAWTKVDGGKGVTPPIKGPIRARQ